MGQLGAVLPLGSEDIQRSWQRCSDRHGLNPDDASALGDSTRKPSEPAQALLAMSSNELNRLTQVVGRSGHSIIVTDANGTIVATHNHSTYRQDFNAAGLTQGQCWGEAFRGTNGIGTCIVERRPTLIHGDQHFVHAHQNLSCAAAPIFDEQHNLLAILDTSTVNPSRDPTRAMHTLAMVTESARRIEQNWFKHTHRTHWQLEIQSQEHGLALYAIDDRQRVVGLDSSGHRALAPSQDWLGFYLAHALDAPTLESLWDTADTDLRFHIPIFSHGCFLGFGHLVPPDTSAPADDTAFIPPSPAPRTPLERLNHGDSKLTRTIKQGMRLIDRKIPVLLSGETGVGKDRFAQAMHQSSERASGPMVVLNCAAIAPDLIESELFGYVPGAFTGANPQGRKGCFEQANGGTLFLDEIGDMPMDAQAKLLRAVEDQCITPVGGEHSIQVDIALISASHQALDEAVEQGRFRQDLLYRLRGLELHLPPLRLRQDKEAALRAVARECMSDMQLNLKISDPAWQTLFDYPWPGNFREAHRVCASTFAVADNGSTIQAADWLGLRPAQDTSVAEQTDHLHQALCHQALAACGGNASAAAKKLGVSRATFYRWRSVN